ncbi:hypothetical protein QYF61_014412 [Mycteria americana]|uniref:Uncharacterized protein n=1 Tax=Mycteria americana TaxID=33587 RepID=A0AAN7NP44_MYCAM|nr:hypothetical protein QYF61_014412 [Mycteria americana]
MSAPGGAAGLLRSARRCLAWPLPAPAGGAEVLSCRFSPIIALGRGRVNKQFKNIIQRSAPRLDSYEWQGVWNSMGKYLGQWAPPVFWNFTPEQVQNPEKLVKYLEKVCCHPGNSTETQITATCWGLAHAYQALFNTIQNSQREEKVSGSNNKMTGTAATPPSATGTVPTPTSAADPAATPTLAAGTAATQTPATGTAAEPENQPVLVSVAPIHKKKYTRKSAMFSKG